MSFTFSNRRKRLAGCPFYRVGAPITHTIITEDREIVKKARELGISSRSLALGEPFDFGLVEIRVLIASFGLRSQQSLAGCTKDIVVARVMP